MPRVKGGPGHARRRKRVLKRASGFVGGPGTLYRVAREFTRKADVYAYEHRKQKKRLFRSLWITRLSAALRQRGISYNRFIPALAVAGIELNRKMLSELAAGDPAAFDAVVELAKPHLA
jgi:large subunit ribosomal protein L20